MEHRIILKKKVIVEPEIIVEVSGTPLECSLVAEAMDASTLARVSLFSQKSHFLNTVIGGAKRKKEKEGAVNVWLGLRVVGSDACAGRRQGIPLTQRPTAKLCSRASQHL